MKLSQGGRVQSMYLVMNKKAYIVQNNRLNTEAQSGQYLHEKCKPRSIIKLRKSSSSNRIIKKVFFRWGGKSITVIPLCEKSMHWMAKHSEEIQSASLHALWNKKKKYGISASIRREIYKFVTGRFKIVIT